MTETKRKTKKKQTSKPSCLNCQHITHVNRDGDGFGYCKSFENWVVLKEGRINCSRKPRYNKSIDDLIQERKDKLSSFKDRIEKKSEIETKKNLQEKEMNKREALRKMKEKMMENE